MQQLRRAIILALLISVLIPVCLGQGNRKTKRQESPVVRTELDDRSEESKSVGRATVSYDPRHDSTSVFFELPVIYQRQPLDTFMLQALFEVAGREMSRPDTVILALEAYEKRGVFKTARAFKLKA
ncbi:MAG TPA: hypothetical protein VM911_10050, partial [Pyrinomonadaceae bacterium]|nr:hypothetical protein [Pyrinomonadaceae bacterium]